MQESFYLNRIVSLAVAETVRSFVTGHKVSVKWPNDIYIDEKKVAGILIENIIQGNKISASVAGIGLNVNQKVFDQLPRAASLSHFTGKELDTGDVLSCLCEMTEPRYLQLRAGKMEMIRREYLDQLYLIGKRSEFRTRDESFAGTITGVSPEGQLILETGGGIKKFFSPREIIFPE